MKCLICNFIVGYERSHRQFNIPGQFKEHETGGDHLNILNRLKKQDNLFYCFTCKKACFNQQNFTENQESEKQRRMEQIADDNKQFPYRRYVCF